MRTLPELRAMHSVYLCGGSRLRSNARYLWIRNGFMTHWSQRPETEEDASDDEPLLERPPGT